jgi:hypothetical protein
MAASFSSGPYISYGNLNTSQVMDTDCGPDLSYQGNGIIDPRFTQSIGAAPGRKIQAIYSAPFIPLVDAVPQAAATACLFAAASVPVTTAASAAVSAGLGVGFISANMAFVGQVVPGSGNIAANVPFLPAGLAPTSANLVTAAAALEFGFGFGGNIATTASGNPALTLAAAANSKYFYPGQKICVAGAGNAGGTIPLLTTVSSINASTGVITMAANALATNASGTQVGTADPTGLYAWPWQVAGVDAFMDSAQGLQRGIQAVSSNAGDTTFKLIVRGFDYAGYPMTEVIALNGTSIVFGKKAFKYVTQMNLWNSISATTAGNISVGTSNVFGCTVRSDFWEYMDVYWNSTFQTAAAGGAGNGWLAADATNPATGTTGDVRGTLQIGTTGGNANSFTTNPNGSIRLAAFMSLPPYNALNANNLNFVTLFGQTQYAG